MPKNLMHTRDCPSAPALPRLLVLVLVAALVAACGGSGGGNGNNDSNVPSGAAPPGSGSEPEPAPEPDPEPEAEPAQNTLGGVVIDGPVSDARVLLLDAAGNEIASTRSDSQARFTLSYPEDAAFPLTLTARGGTVLTTGKPPVLNLYARIDQPPDTEIALNPLSALAYRVDQCELPAAARADRLHNLLVTHGFGMEPEGWAEAPWRFPTGETGLRLLVASEALAESTRRALTALQQDATPAAADSLLASLACVPDSATRAAFELATATTLLELHQGQLLASADRIDVVPALEQAASGLFSTNAEVAVKTLPLPAAQRELLQRAAHAALVSAPSQSLFEAYEGLLTGNTSGNDTDGSPLDSALQALASTLQQLKQSAISEPAMLEAWLELSHQPAQERVPDVTLNALPSQLGAIGDHTTISHEASDADVCWRLGPEAIGWSGIAESHEETRVGPIDQFTTLGIRCANSAGLVEHFVDLSVPLELALRFHDEAGDRPEAFALEDPVTIQLDASGGVADSCTLTRSDTGETIDNGTTLSAWPGLEVTASCETAAGVTTRTHAIPVRAAQLSWIPPRTTEDGQPLEDLAGYRIFHGDSSGDYRDSYIAVNDPDQVSLVTEFAAGTRYFVIQAVTERGITSRFSNEVVRHIP